ncbi:hypothetical protein BO94DRAFT_627153 [Aspergillus sclerotioniger CBS 115572]|uniref:Hemerythrin-like domain-containing protein n=1 Tax=Aspergillus sclerotioniger CBS 115572 TaxID=1450535 RepID=A0A317VR92_9EURO|nr:hypothetical protein BO94DRAFT_627153 [Aspergillus sclerotioniger CBS 115572]PWY76079.1 hypothetical protein BO94DRAFT_627153 [Aspergillus sclerotioniger CBS 115572]
MPPHPWADGPWPLLETPSKTKDITTHPALYIANEMAFAHNSMLRGLNSIYLQAPHVSDPTDITDFLFFITSWAAWVSHHHILEEEKMFPGFERVIGIPGFLGVNVEQHHSFQPSLKRLLEYGRDTEPGEYDAKIVRGIIEAMAPGFREHLAGRLSECEAEAGGQDKNVVPPMVLGLRDVTFEGGNDWPVMPPLSAWVVHYFFKRKYNGAWRFLPCDTWGRPRELAFGGGGGE